MKTFTVEGTNTNPDEEAITFLKEDVRTRADFRLNPQIVRKRSRLVTTFNESKGCFEPNNRNLLGGPETLVESETFLVEK